MSTHTQGPWYHTEFMGGMGFPTRDVIHNGDPEKPIARTYARASWLDASLLAAAPQLLEACERARWALESGEDNSDATHEMLCAAIDAAKRTHQQAIRDTMAYYDERGD